MTTETISNRNNILDNLNYALKFAAYIKDDTARKNVEDSITYCTSSVLSAFNSIDEKEAEA